MTLSINAENLTKKFGRITAVNNLSLQVEKGQVLGFLGPNGAGKSTTMKMLTGFLTPSAGQVMIGQYNMATQAEQAKKKIGYLPEGAPAYPDMTSSQFLDFIAGMRGLTGKDKEKRLSFVTQRCQIASVWHQPIETLSKGYKRRVGLAQAILHDPEILILDEPTDGLDPNQKREVRGLISELSEDKAIIVSTHILEEVSAVCNRAIIIAHGEILADDTPLGLTNRAQNYGEVTLGISQNVGEELITKMKARFKTHQIQLISPEMTGDSTTNVLKIMPDDNQISMSEIGQFCLEQKLQIDHLNVDKGRLEDVFYQITRSVA